MLGQLHVFEIGDQLAGDHFFFEVFLEARMNTGRVRTLPGNKAGGLDKKDIVGLAAKPSVLRKRV
jgi:hypothetical protein